MYNCSKRAEIATELWAITSNHFGHADLENPGKTTTGGRPLKQCLHANWVTQNPLDLWDLRISRLAKRWCFPHFFEASNMSASFWRLLYVYIYISYILYIYYIYIIYIYISYILLRLQLAANPWLHPLARDGALVEGPKSSWFWANHHGMEMWLVVSTHPKMCVIQGIIIPNIVDNSNILFQGFETTP